MWNFLFFSCISAKAPRSASGITVSGIIPNSVSRSSALLMVSSIRKRTVRMAITIKAIDLRLTNDQIGAFTLGQYIRCYSEPHNINDLYLLPYYKLYYRKFHLQAPLGICKGNWCLFNLWCKQKQGFWLWFAFSKLKFWLVQNLHHIDYNNDFHFLNIDK